MQYCALLEHDMAGASLLFLYRRYTVPGTAVGDEVGEDDDVA